MQPRTALTAILSAASLVALAPAATAHPNHDGDLRDDVILHVDDSYDSCFFDLHPELTQDEFDEFTKEGSFVMHDLQLSGAEALGRGQVEVNLDYVSTGVDDTKGAWNNTMSHPTADHYLGDRIASPRLAVRVGVSRRVDLGVWGTLDPQSNYGLVGIHSKVTILEQDADMPVSVAVRPTAVSMLGPDELLVADIGFDLSVSRNYKGLQPYLGISSHGAASFERSDEVDLDPGEAWYSSAFAGLAYGWKNVRLAAEANTGPLTTYGMRLGGNF